MAPTLLVGESLVGEGNEVAHVDLLIGSKDGPVGEAFANARGHQHEGPTNHRAVGAPHLPGQRFHTSWRCACRDRALEVSLRGMTVPARAVRRGLGC